MTVTALMLAVTSAPAFASVAIVPDDFGTIQAAIHSEPDSVVVRAGFYDETVTLGARARRPSHLMADPAAASRPILRRLILNTDDDTPSSLNLTGLHFVAPVDFQMHGAAIRFWFESCTFDSAFVQTGWIDPHDIDMLSFYKCMIRGYGFASGSEIRMAADTVETGTVAVFMQHAVTVFDCVFRGSPAAGLALSGPEAGFGHVAGNLFENCADGVGISDYRHLRFEDNVVRDCPNWGVRLSGEIVEAYGNEVQNSGTGMHVRGSEQLTVSRNLIEGAAREGLVCRGGWGHEVRDNVVLRSGREGIALETDWAPTVVAGNTSALNGEDGLVFKFFDYNSGFTITVENNIAFGNAGWGMTWNRSELPAIGCNDWFGNTLGPVSGTPPGASDLMVDPQFCDIDADNVSLLGNSPLIDAPGCGLIGALGVGCGATPVLVALMRAEPAEDGMRIEWQWGGLDRPANFWIERAADASGPWARIVTDRIVNDGITVDWDRHVEPGRGYFYRLAWIAKNGEMRWSESIIATALGPASFTMKFITPNPSSGPVEITWSLPRVGDVDIAIFDIAGREVARLANGLFVAGNHRTTWNGLTVSRSTAPGLYFVRLRYDGREITRRILLRK